MADTPQFNYRTVTPYLLLSDADAEIRFLTTAFDASIQLCSRDDENRIVHAEVTIGDSLVMLAQANEQYKPREASLYLWVPDVDESYRRAIAAGARSESTPEDKPYGHRNAGVIDPNGIAWWLGAPVKRT